MVGEVRAKLLSIPLLRSLLNAVAVESSFLGTRLGRRRNQDRIVWEEGE